MAKKKLEDKIRKQDDMDRAGVRVDSDTDTQYMPQSIRDDESLRKSGYKREGEGPSKDYSPKGKGKAKKKRASPRQSPNMPEAPKPDKFWSPKERKKK